MLGDFLGFFKNNSFNFKPALATYILGTFCKN